MKKITFLLYCVFLLAKLNIAKAQSGNVLVLKDRGVTIKSFTKDNYIQFEFSNRQWITGQINWIKKDWQASCLPGNPRWNNVWGQNVRFAVMTENLSSEFGEVDYHWHEVNKAEEDVWLVYPWELDNGID